MRQIRENRKVLQERFGVRTIALFGSVARGEATSQSDIDLFVELEKRNFRTIAGLWDFLEKSLGEKVDLVYDHPGLRASLRRSIEAEMIRG
ncbi:nucleotidyltransferase family protein [Nitratifractor sp.]